ncbi:hypothetical protein [Rhodomicrobium sp. R_RK_3]|nr:hypothetical protein [Rhodomicrobium sp. R_RK_3]
MSEHRNKTPGDPPDPNDKPHKEYWLDEAIADSMVASDPVSAVSKGEPTAPPREGDDDAPADENEEEPHEERKLDEAIAASMDASDPVAVITKGAPTTPPRRPRPDDTAPKPPDKMGG